MDIKHVARFQQVTLFRHSRELRRPRSCARMVAGATNVNSAIINSSLYFIVPTIQRILGESMTRDVFPLPGSPARIASEEKL
jgi:hypothetical protein